MPSVPEEARRYVCHVPEEARRYACCAPAGGSPYFFFGARVNERVRPAAENAEVFLLFGAFELLATPAVSST